MAVPTMISMLVVVIYNMADTFFIGQTKDPLQVAAVSLATPVFYDFYALGHLFGIGAAQRYREHWENAIKIGHGISVHSAAMDPWDWA